MLRKTFFLLVLFCLSTDYITASPILEIKNYCDNVDFTDKKIVLIKEGDSKEYKETSYNDSKWTLTSLPLNWKQIFPEWEGICWYRIHVKFPNGIPKNSIGIRLGVITDVDEVFFNGKKIGSSGKFPPSRVSAYDRKRLYEVPTTIIEPGKENILSIRIAGLFPYEMGPIKGKFCIGPFQKLQRNYLLREFIDVIFVIIYIVVSVYFGLVFVRSKIDKEYLFFASFSFCSTIYLFLQTQLKYVITENFILLKRIEYLVLFIIPLLMLEYITFFFKKKHTIIYYIYYAITFFAMIAILVYSEISEWNRILLYVVEPSWLIPIGFSGFICIKEFRRDADAKYIIATFPIIWLFFLNDILINRGVYDFIRLSNYGFLLVIIGTAIIMRRRYLRLFDEVEDLRIKESWKTSISEDTKDKLDDAIEFLKENYISDISREGLAAQLDISPDYLGKVFKIYTGKKISEYINELRIVKAADELREKDTTITDVAFSVGFESLSTFYRVFQKIMGESPKNYREKFSNVKE